MKGGTAVLDDLAALRLQMEWGIDEALSDTPLDRFAPVPVRLPIPAASPAASRAAAPGPGPAPRIGATPDAACLPDLDAVHAALDAFRTHPLRPTASSTVPPGGNLAADLVVVSEAPGADDDRSGQAWSGKAGILLDRVLGSAGLGRDAAVLCFLVPWRPPGGRAPTDTEVALALPFLHRTLALLRPRYLVVFGEGPLRALVDPAASLRGIRGRWAEARVPGLPDPVPTLPMLPAERWLQTPASRQATWADLLTVRETILHS